MKLLFTICGRAGSKGLKSKNLKSLSQKPLVEYILCLIHLFSKASPHVEYFIGLNTDSDELIDIVHSINPNVKTVLRKPELANDTVGKIEVIRDTYLTLSEKYGEFDLVIDLDITSPLRTLDDLEKLIHSHLEDSSKDVYFSVVPSRRNPFFNMVKEEDSKISIVNQSSFTSRQQAPNVYDINGAMYSYKPRFLKENAYIFNGDIGVIEMKDSLILDIDSEEDFLWLEFLFPKLLSESKGLQDIYNCKLQ
ncbi:acylneuraminate cytidylyltransferase family protein [Enterococcus sp. 669A]|uniref:Acylneuraminate cytidylyltransferase family protein n=1 Tax=Candidatus Enterococcus moelleringii TaxID=2815325 RepID=A0ABS3LF17_9ENTE|nr:acylneuraminate cytidylyltransferase family protein [Enterococcus sp. 669A]MBO1308218.1 acylneuraminate cytidylyltransferase family protein [Enterococcus sp. 669A]